MSIEIKGNYEIRIAVIDLDFAENINNFTEAEEFLAKAEELGTVYSLGAFIENINNQELDDFSNSYLRAILVNRDDEKDIVEVDDFHSLNLFTGSLTQI